jgi:hypothetical protein
MKLRTLGFRFDPPGPFWLEDLMYFVIDEGRRLPARVVEAASQVRRFARKLAAFDPRSLVNQPVPPQSEVLFAVAPRRTEVPPLDEPETWALATEPLLAVGTGSQAAIALHTAAAEQLDALTYALDRLRDDLRPIMTYARLAEDSTLHELPDRAALEANIEARLELSRQNAETRPKHRVRSAA